MTLRSSNAERFCATTGRPGDVEFIRLPLLEELASWLVRTKRGMAPRSDAVTPFSGVSHSEERRDLLATDVGIVDDGAELLEISDVTTGAPTLRATGGEAQGHSDFPNEAKEPEYDILPLPSFMSSSTKVAPAPSPGRIGSGNTLMNGKQLISGSPRRHTRKITAALTSLFAVFDKDGDGTISKSELATVLRSIGYTPESDDELDQMIAQVDKSGSGTVNFQEFTEMMADKMAEKKPKKDEMRDKFRLFDEDDDGFITREEMRQIIVDIGEKLPEEEIEAMITDADQNGDGKIDYDEFLQIMFAGRPSSRPGSSSSRPGSRVWSSQRGRSNSRDKQDGTRGSSRVRPEESGLDGVEDPAARNSGTQFASKSSATKKNFLRSSFLSSSTAGSERGLKEMLQMSIAVKHLRKNERKSLGAVAVAIRGIQLYDPKNAKSQLMMKLGLKMDPFDWMLQNRRCTAMRDGRVHCPPAIPFQTHTKYGLSYSGFWTFSMD